MSSLTEILKSIANIEQDLLALERQKAVLKRQAWAVSGQTIGRANQLMTKAVLTLISKGAVINTGTLQAEVSQLARPGDRFAAELCADWLQSSAETGSVTPTSTAAPEDFTNLLSQ